MVSDTCHCHYLAKSLRGSRGVVATARRNGEFPQRTFLQGRRRSAPARAPQNVDEDWSNGGVSSMIVSKPEYTRREFRPSNGNAPRLPWQFSAHAAT